MRELVIERKEKSKNKNEIKFAFFGLYNYITWIRCEERFGHFLFHA
jgi:hypothetical protein